MRGTTDPAQLLKRPCFHVHFTPTGACWMNLVERWSAHEKDWMRRCGSLESKQSVDLAFFQTVRSHELVSTLPTELTATAFYPLRSSSNKALRRRRMAE
jgi:hypothetical protein